MSDSAPRLLPDTDYLLDKDKAAMGTVLTAYQGGDPLVHPPAFGYPEHMQTEIERRVILEQDRTSKMNAAVFQNPDSGWGQIKTFMDGVFDRYKTANEQQLIKKPKNEQEAIAQMQQMRPVEVDPNEVAAIRQLAVKLDAQMKAVDPRTSFWTDSRTKGYADWLNRESGPGTPGFMTSGEQPVNMGVVGRTAYSAWQGIEGIASPAMSLIHGAWDLGRRSILSMGGPDIGPSYPTNYIETDDGKIINNGGRAPSMMDGLVMAWAHATNQNVERAAANANRAQEWEQANRAGFGGIVTSVSRLGGELVGMGPAFGVAGKVGEAVMGTLTTRGLQALGTLRLAGGLQKSERALKIINTMSKGMGEAVGMAGYETVTNGRVDGYGAAFAHGLMMAPVLMTLGALGKKTEWFAANRVNMPGYAARAVAGALEGAGFAGLETLAPDVLPKAWGFIRDPSQSTFEAFAKNMLAFSLVKMATGRTTVAQPEELAIRRGIGRAQFAEQVAQGKVSPDQIAEAPVPDAGKLTELGNASIQAREGKTNEERQTAQTRQREIEAEMDVQEFGKGPAEKNVAEFQEKGPEKTVEDQNLSLTEIKDEFKQLKEKPNKTSEDRKRMTQLMDLASRRAGRDLTRAVSLRAEPKPQAAGGEDAEIASMAKKLGISVEELKAQMGGEEKAAEPRVVEQVEGKEPRPMQPVADKGPPEKQLVQEGGKEGLEPEKPAPPDRGKARAPRPLSPEEELLRGQEQARAEAAGESVPRGTVEKLTSEVEQRRGQSRTESGERKGPQSFQTHPTRQIEPSADVAPVRAADIYSEMEGREGSKGVRIPLTSKRVGVKEGDPVRVPMRAGKIGGAGRGVLGVFKFFENLVRTKEGRDLAVAAHEWSHAMHRHMTSGGGKDFVDAAKKQVAAAIASDPRIASEMAVALKDYPGSAGMPKWLQWMETWAEWHARNLLGEVGLDAKLPAISDYMRGWLASPKNAALREQYQRIQGMLYRYNAQGSLERVRQSRVSGGAPPTETEKAMRPSIFTRAVRAVNKALFDDMADLKASQDKWLKAVGRNPEDVSIMEDPSRLFDTLRMTANKTVEHFVMDGVRQPDGTKIPGLRDVMEGVKGRTEDFIDYVVAVRNMELFKKGKDIQLPPQDYVEAVKQLGAKNPDFADQLTKLKRWTDALVDYVAGAGNISAEDAKKIKDAYIVYVPFFRAIEGPAQHGQGRGLAERGTGLSRIKGSTFAIRSPFIALPQVARSMVAKAHQNQVMSALFKMSMGHEAGGLATIVPRTSVPTDHPLRRLLDAIEKKVQLPGDQQMELESVFEALRQADALNPETITTFSQKVIPTGEKNIIAFTPRLTDAEIANLVKTGANRGAIELANNKLQWLEVDTKVYEALMGIDKMPQLPEAMQPVMKWLQAPRDLVRFFATGVAPGFVLANVLRDAMSAPLFDRSGAFRPFGGFVKLIRGAIEYHKNGQLRELYEELGVKTSSFWTEGRQRALIGEQTTLWQKAQAMADKVQHWFSHPENYIRMAEFRDAYDAAKKAGRSEIEARMEALEAGREITVNFARAGVWARVLNQLVPYFNAGMPQDPTAGGRGRSR